jgi:Uma2 family endonuclease
MAIGSIPPLPNSDEIRGPGCAPQYDRLVTEDDTPVDNIYAERQQLLLTNALLDSWHGPGEGCPRFIATNVGLFYSDRAPPYVPDVLVSLDAGLPQGDFSLKENRSYYMWRYNKPPDILVEVVSNTEGNELTTKLKGYARLGTIYYIVWDPFLFLGEKSLYCFALERGRYVPCEPWFPEVELGVKTWEGSYGDMSTTFLRWCDRHGNLIPTGAERAEQEKQRAEQEKQRAEQEKQRAEQEKQRAVKLAEKLRALGVDPDQP